MAIWQVASWGSLASFKSAGLHFKLCQRVWGFLFRYFLKKVLSLCGTSYGSTFGFVVSTWQSELKPGNTIVNMNQECQRSISYAVEQTLV
jgi:hypothetical protein